MTRAWTLCAALLLGACVTGGEPGYGARDPAELTCGCHDGDSCYAGAAELSSRSGETAESAEQLMYFAECACFQGSVGGCNTLSHFAKDWIAACDAGKDPARSCAIAGFVYHHGVRVPSLNGRSFARDPAAAAAAFDRACRAGSQLACARASTP